MAKCGAKPTLEHTPLYAQVHVLRAQGLTQQAIAKQLGILQPKVSYLLNPEVHRRNNLDSNRRYRARGGPLT